MPPASPSLHWTRPLIDLLAFDDETGAVRARIELLGDRLVDLLASGDPINARDVQLVDLQTNRVEELPSRSIDARRLAIVVATGPRGARSRRVETECRPVSVTIGRYVVHGYLHAPAPADPIDRVFERVWLPLTEAILEYQGSGGIRRERFDVLLVNREFARTLSVIDEGTHERHWLAAGQSTVFPQEPVGV
jgi:hypothetical protein